MDHPGEWDDGKALQEKADTDPDYPHSNGWIKRNEYDGTGEDITLKGRLWKCLSNSKDSGISEVEIIYGYDIYGNTVLCRLNVPGWDPQITRYCYNNLGHIIEVEYPEAAYIKKVVYLYNGLGQNVSIGTPEHPEKFAKYTYNADGSLAVLTVSKDGGETQTYTYDKKGNDLCGL